MEGRPLAAIPSAPWKNKENIMKFIKTQSQIKEVLIVTAMVVAVFGHTTSAHAYANAPIWANMDMLNVTFNTNNKTLSVEPQASGRLGTNPIVLLVATNGTFDLTKPWGVLNGTAYSRSLGWYDPYSKTSTNIISQVQAVYGSDAFIWITSSNASAGLNAYQAVGKYGVNSLGTTNADGTPVIDPSANGYAPIFGTAGSSTTWQWNGQMDHNAYALSLGNITTTNQIFTTTYTVFIGDDMGMDIDPSADTTTTWTWQGPATLTAPALTIQNTIAIEWPRTSTNYVLQSSPTFNPATWTTVTNTSGVINGNTVILVDPTSPQQFFHLQLVP
jgi:hypothetical protein